MIENTLRIFHQSQGGALLYWLDVYLRRRSNGQVVIAYFAYGEASFPQEARTFFYEWRNGMKYQTCYDDYYAALQGLHRVVKLVREKYPYATETYGKAAVKLHFDQWSEYPFFKEKRA